jgi:hypothetical protein
MKGMRQGRRLGDARTASSPVRKRRNSYPANSPCCPTLSCPFVASQLQRGGTTRVRQASLVGDAGVDPGAHISGSDVAVHRDEPERWPDHDFADLVVATAMGLIERVAVCAQQGETDDRDCRARQSPVAAA